MKADPRLARVLDEAADERKQWIAIAESLTAKLEEKDAEIERLRRDVAAKDAEITNLKRLFASAEDYRDLYPNNIDYLSARETTLMAMLRELSPEDVVTKLSLEGELEQVRAELKEALSS